MLSFFRKSKIRGKAGIALTADGIAYAGLAADEPSPVLRSCGFTASPQAAVLTQLGALSKHENLLGYQLGVCLDRSRFNLSLIDAPAVEEDELLQALTWKVKDLIDFSLDELIMDYLDVPPTKSGGKMVYAVTAHQSAIQNIVDQTNTDDNSLQSIDIPALALQNIINCLPQAEEGIALLNLTQRDSLLTLGRGVKLYLSHGVDARSTDLRDDQIGQDSSRTQSLFDNLLLEIQRSLDYYDSFFADPPIRHLLVPALDHTFDELIDYLDQNLSIGVRHLTLDEIVAPAEDLALDAEHFGELLLAVGAALRQPGLDA